MNEKIATALMLTTMAGLATTVGSLIALVVKNPGPKFMSFTLGFSAGVMLLVSMVELYPKSSEEIGPLMCLAWFLIGMVCFLGMDAAIPHDYAGQHDHSIGAGTKPDHASALKRTGSLVAVGIAIHNLPEGMVTFAGAMHDVKLGATLAIAIAIHNIPEGIAVSAPVYAATGSRKKAFMLSFLSGASEPVGAALAALVLMPFLSPSLVGAMLALVAGIMVAISLDELIPVAKSYETEHLPIIGIICGIAVMGVSLYLTR